jgi:hypothetical protein
VLGHLVALPQNHRPHLQSWAPPSRGLASCPSPLPHPHVVYLGVAVSAVVSRKRNAVMAQSSIPEVPFCNVSPKPSPFGPAQFYAPAGILDRPPFWRDAEVYPWESRATKLASLPSDPCAANWRIPSREGRHLLLLWSPGPHLPRAQAGGPSPEKSGTLREARFLGALGL